MSKEIFISSTPHETRLAIVEHDALTEIYYERENEYTLAGSIYNGRVTRVLPGMQSSFVDIGLERDAFLYITDFMEEAGDSADFEAGAASDAAPRRSSSDGRGGENRSDGRGGRDRSRNDGRDRNFNRADRSDPADRPAAEPTDADLFSEAVASLDPSGTGAVTGRQEGDRSRRGGRNRSGRDRNFNSDGTPRRNRDAGRDDQRQAAAGTFAEPSTDEPHILAAPAPVESSDELGEGAPGADGSRRWRGRRGRRGGSSTRSPQEATPFAQPEVSEAEPAGADTGPIANSYESAEMNGNRETRVDRVNRSDRGRGGRSDARNESRSEPARRMPRGFAPSASLYKVEGAEETHETPAAPAYPTAVESQPSDATPLILPGEVLRKYRPADEASVPQAPASSPAASEFTVSGWDGSNVLPGETLRPRNVQPDARNVTRTVDSGGVRNDRSDRTPRDAGRGRGDRDARSTRSDRENRSPRPADLAMTAQPAPVEDPAPEAPTYLTSPETVPASHLITPLNSTFIAPPPMPESTTSAPLAADASESDASYEPTEASASFRVDPVAPREFRQAAPVLDVLPMPEADVATLHDDLGPAPEPVLENAAFGEDSPESAPADATEPVIASAVERDPVDLHTASPALQHALGGAASHELTSLSDSGNLHSEVATSEVPSHESSAAEPMLHQSAVVDPAPVEFAPGDGTLEEELFEEEDENPAPVSLHAHSVEDFEQETLEGAPDLGTMLEDISIDHITRTEPAELETDAHLLHDESFEEEDEDFLEEDQQYDSEEESAAEEGEESEDQPAAGSLDELEHSEYSSGFEGDHGSQPASASADSEQRPREPRRDSSRDRGGRSRDGRRDGRDRGRSGNRDSRYSRDSSGGFSSPGADRIISDRPRNDRDGSRRDSRGMRSSAQLTDLPAISDLLKPGQELLCQIAKEPIAKKGARITSHIALPGRFLVFMPTVSHTGVSRKIESDHERRRLKEILLSERGEATGGFIVRTAAAGASEEELRSDLRFLLNLWTDIKTRSESSKSPALIYHDLNLVERVLRDQVTDNFSAIWVDTESQYEQVLRFLQRFQPSLIRRVKLYTKETPLFEQFGITEEINKALRSKVWLKSGGSIVINQTEALVAIDINTGKFVGKTARLEDTIVKTNLDAIPEIVRQIRLRDLGGIIIIDFIDMDDRKNRNKVMAALEDELKNDRAPSKVLPFNDFGLVAITRKRVKQSLERTLSATCNVCAGTGMTKSPVTVCNDIYVEMRKMHKHLDRGDVMLRVHPEVVKQLKAPATNWLHEMEEMCGKTILVKSDPSLHPEQFDIH